MKRLNLIINSKDVDIENLGNGFYEVYLNKSKVFGKLLKRNDGWFIQGDNPFTDSELKTIGFEIEKLEL
ncbi:hypothetical protein [Mucilaginibacter sp. FT3.2]|uniref:hypothetical protein n=1 Tax=Mucilaginibacter sp. FT3.2 TaxID=2723090 RepID=UPI0016106869|nr:hypothetical protein [Mucilaginibacter sp. FT3.2]MBB6231427.1 hypothetical protein [Mucilaginibacter sp. FT3.2]